MSRTNCQLSVKVYCIQTETRHHKVLNLQCSEFSERKIQSLERALFKVGTSKSSLKSLYLGHNLPYFTVGFLDLCLYEYPWGRIHVKKNKSIGTYSLTEIQLNCLHHQKLSRIHDKQRPHKSSLLVVPNFIWRGEEIVCRERMAKADNTKSSTVPLDSPLLPLFPVCE